MTAPLESWEDFLHPPGPAANWRESYYFGFFVEQGPTGLTYISLSPHQHAAVRMIFLSMPDGRTLVSIRQEPLPRFQDTVLSEGALQFHCLDPSRRWHLQAEEDCLAIPCQEEISSALRTRRADAAPGECVPVSFELDFEAGMPPFHFPTTALDFLGAGQNHVEQMGWVSGKLRIGGKTTSLAAPASRDHSWGVRDWLRPEWYSFLNLHCGQDLFLGAAISRVEGREISSGFVYQDGRLQRVVLVTMEVERAPGDLHLQAGRARVVAEQGQVFDVELNPSSFFHIGLAREGGWQAHDCVTAVTCQFDGQPGRGIVEYEQREAVTQLVPGEGSLW